jgi:predicted RNA-binding Zn-ribbon protein involved in translation (DUF1610 family)
MSKLEYTEEDVNAIIDRMPNGKFAKSDVLKTAQEYYGVSEEEGKRIIEEYDKKKESRLVIKVKEEPDSVNQIIKEDLKKTGKILGYLMGATVGASIIAPTMIRKLNQISEGQASEILAFPFIPAGYLILNAIAYSKLFETNPKLAAACLITQGITNLGSGIYEYVRDVKKKAEKISNKKLVIKVKKYSERSCGDIIHCANCPDQGKTYLCPSVKELNRLERHVGKIKKRQDKVREKMRKYLENI